MKINKQNSEHYYWGSNCEGWRFINNEETSIIFETMPSGTSEQKHYHKKARQFFFILTGKAVFTINEKRIEINQNEGIEINPNEIHFIKNETNESIDFLVYSNPSTKNDRINVE